MTTDDYNVYIGQYTEFTGPCWNGLFDDVRKYSYALSAAGLYNDPNSVLRSP